MKIAVVFLLCSVFVSGAVGQDENICESDVCAQICNPVGSSYKCDCIKGYILMEDGVSCKPEKRALKKGGRCENNNPCDQDCTDTGTAIKCSCREGYELAADERTCNDIDECQLGINECLETEDCENELGTYYCYDKEDNLFGENDVDYDKKCPPGFRFNLEKGVCDDINECLFDLMCVAPKVCNNTIGSFYCEDVTPKCPPGYFYNTNIQTCDDINECDQTKPVCKETEECFNEPGGFKCTEKTTTSSSTTTATKETTRPTRITRKPITCPQGYYFSKETNKCEDVNECSTAIHDCDVLERCDNTIGSYHCSRIFGCGTGYTLNVANGLCEDDNECVLGTHSCKDLGPNFKCKNTLGSYRCEIIRDSRFNSNTLGVIKPLPVSTTTPATTSSQRTTSSTASTTPQSKPTPATPTRSDMRPSAAPISPFSKFVHDNVSTITESPFVSTRAYTTQTVSSTRPETSYNRPQIFLKPDPSTPEVVPHYIYRMTTPHRQHNIIGGQLKNCLPGYKINAKGECEDINECENNPCGKNELCLNFNGRYQCAAPTICSLGYELNESGDTCIDIDECTRGTHKCNPTQICRNYPGFHTCECPPGHHLKYSLCEDVDECRLFRPCASYAECINTKGSYRCECKEGFRSNGTKCEEINECIENTGLCEQKCVNIWGSYRCSCNPGFLLNSDNRTCTDIDECERFKDKRLCIGTCKNVPGSYTCECPKGYQLASDGRVCRDIDECDQKVCLKDEVCLNLQGSFRCYSIKCPPNYVKDPYHKTHCKRLQQSCDVRDYQCLMMPSQYSYQYLTMVSNLPLSTGPIQIMEIKGPAWFTARAEFTMKLLDVICPFGIPKADETYFQKKQDRVNSVAIYMAKSIQGPQEIKLQIQMRLYNGNVLVGNNMIYLIIIVSEHPF